MPKKAGLQTTQVATRTEHRKDIGCMSIVTPKSHRPSREISAQSPTGQVPPQLSDGRNPLFSAAPTKPALVRGRSVRRWNSLQTAVELPHQGLPGQEVRQRATCKGHHKICRGGSYLEQEPKEELCERGSPIAGSTNCGRNAKKNSRSLGLSRPVSTPLPNIRPQGRLALACG